MVGSTCTVKVQWVDRFESEVHRSPGLSCTKIELEPERTQGSAEREVAERSEDKART